MLNVKAQMPVSHSLWSVLVTPRQPSQFETVRPLNKVGVIRFMLRKVLENLIQAFISNFS